MENEEKKEMKNFLKNKKNIIIIILSICLLISIASKPTASNKNEISNNTNNTRTDLVEEKNKLQEEKQTLEKEKNDLSTKVEELEKEAALKAKQKTTISSQTPKTTQTTTSKTNTNSNTKSSTTSSTTSNTRTTSTVPNQNVNNNNSQMVWVGNTGTKYHIQSCRTLKGKGYQITMKQALAEGRQACKVCH